MFRPVIKIFTRAAIFICLFSISLTSYGDQAEAMIDEWISSSILRISQKVKDISAEYEDPYFTPQVLIGPIVTRKLPGREFYESQFSLLLRDSIYLKLAAGLAPIRMKILDVDLLPKAIAASRLKSAARLNALDIASSYEKDESMRRCVNQLLDVADMIVLGQITLKDTQALTTFTILRKKKGQLYLDRTPMSIQALPNIPDISMDMEKKGMDKMMAFVISSDNEIKGAVGKFVTKFADAWEDGNVEKMMSYYDKNASAVTLTVSENSRVELTNVLDKDALELVMVEFFERYSVTSFDFSNPEIYDVKRNSKNVVSCNVDFYADITIANGRTRRLPLLSFYMQLRRDGKSWKIYFQRIKEVPKYSIQVFK